MAELEINANLVGCKVCTPSRPEWGVGTVLRVQSTTLNGQPVYRVSIQFATGHRTLVVPPAKLIAPATEPHGETGWLDRIGGPAPVERLTALPEAVREFLGTSAQRLIVLARLYELGEDSPALLKWARSQTGVADPLSVWTRDEIRSAFEEFCRRRDELLRQTVAALRSSAAARGLEEALAEVPVEARDRMLAIVRPPRDD